MGAAGRCKKICISDLNKRADIVKRILQGAKIGEKKPSINFSLVFPAFFKVDTVRGTRRFNGVNIEKNTTHIFTTRFDPSIVDIDDDGEHFMLMDDKYYKILRSHNVDESNFWMMYECTNRGFIVKVESNA